MTATPPLTAGLPGELLVAELRALIDAARQRVAVAVNAELSSLYWQVGQRIHRAGYGEALAPDFGENFGESAGRQLEPVGRREVGQGGLLEVRGPEMGWPLGGFDMRIWVRTPCNLQVDSPVNSDVTPKVTPNAAIQLAVQVTRQVTGQVK